MNKTYVDLLKIPLLKLLNVNLSFWDRRLKQPEFPVIGSFDSFVVGRPP